MKILFWTPYNRARFKECHKDKSKPHPALTEKWIVPRFKIWKETCLMSILNQSYENFKYYFCCDPLTKDIIDPLFSEIKDPRVILQYSGTDEARKRIHDIGSSGEQIISIRLDSDDMYHKDAVSELITEGRVQQWFAWVEGYGFNYKTRKLYHYKCHNIGPFFAHRYIYPNEFKKKPMVTEIAHDLIKQKNPKILSVGKFIVGITGMNTTSRERSKLFYEEILGNEKSQILKDYGL